MVKLNWEKISCHLALLPVGPEGVSTYSWTQLSKLLWSVTTVIGDVPIHPAHFTRLATMAYAYFSLGDQFNCDAVNFLLKKLTGTHFCPLICSKTATMAVWEASVLIWKGVSGMT